MVTESRKAILAFEVTGQNQLLSALQTLGTVESRLKALANDAAAVTGGGIDPQSSAALYRGLFKDNEAATRDFDRALQQTKANTKQSVAAMVQDFARLEAAMKQLQTLQARKFTAADFPGQNLPNYTNPDLPGSIDRVAGPGGGFYPVDSSGQRLTTDPLRTRPAAASVVQQDALRNLEREITQLLARALGRDAGFAQNEAASRPIGPSPAEASRLQSVVSGMEAAGRRITAVWDENGRTMVSWERTVNGQIQRGQANLQLLQSAVSRGALTTTGGAGLPPTGPGAPAAAAGEPDPQQRAEIRRGVTAFLRSFVDEATGVITDTGVGSNLGQRYEGEQPGPAAERAVGARQLDAEYADLKNAAKLEADRMVGQVNDLVRTTGQSYQSAAQTVREQNEARLRQTPVQYQAAVITAFDKAASSANYLSRSLDTGSRAVLKEAQLRQTESQTGLAKYTSQFQQGFYGRRELPFAEQIGQVAKFSLLYGAAYQALFAFQQGLQAAVTQAIDFNSALIELSIATSRTTGEATEFADRLGGIATSYGLAPGEGIRTGAAAVGIFGLQDTNNMEGQVAAFTEAVGQVAFVTGRTSEQVTQDLGAISQAFDLNAGSSRIAQDLDAYFSKKFGSPAGGTLETVAQIGSLGSEAGFSQQEVSALASVLQSRTGQTPAATAGFLSQFFGRAGDPALKQTFAELGIDVAKPFRDQIEELSGVMASGKLGEDLRLQIINAFGRGRSGQAAAIITEAFPEVTKAAKDAETEAAGAGQQQFEERLRSVGGQLRVLQGTFIELAVSIGQSGLLDIIGAAAFALKELVEATNTLLGLFNLLPRGVRDTIIALGLLTLALRSTAIKSALGSALAATGSSRGLQTLTNLGFGAPSSNLATRATQFGVGGGPTVPAGAINPIAGAGGIGAVGAAIKGLLLNPITIAIGGLLAIGSLNDQANNLRVAMADATGAMAAFGSAQTPEELLASASSLRDQADRVQESPGLLIDLVSFGYAQDEADRMAERLRDLADEAEEAADQEARFVNAQARSRQVGVFSNPAVVDDLVTGMQALEAANVGPTQRLRLLSEAIRQVGKDSAVTEAELRLVPGRFQREFADAINSATGEDLGLKDENGNIFEDLFGINKSPFAVGIGGPRALGGGLGEDEITNALTNPEEGGFDIVGLEDRVREQLSEKGRLTSRALNRILDTELANFDVTQLGGVDLTEEGQAAFKSAVEELIRDRLGNFVGQFDPNEVFNRFELKRYMDEVLTPNQEASVASLTSQGYDEGSQTQIQEARRQIQQLQDIPRTNRPGSNFYNRLAELETNLARNLLARSAGMREVQQKLAESDREVRQIGRRFFRIDARIALRSGNLSLLTQVIEQGNQKQIDIVRSMIRNQIELTKQKLLADGAVGAAAEQAVALMDVTGKALAASQAKVEAKLARLREALNNIDQIAKTTVTTNQFNAPDSLDDSAAAAEEPTDTAAQIAAARQAAEAARTDDAVAQARAAVAQASADLAAAEPGTVEYYSALQAFYEAQRSLSDTILQTSAARILARASDRGSPLVMAEAQLRIARDQLRSEAEGTLAYYEALQQFNDAKRALSEAIRQQKFVQDQLAGDITDPVDQARAEARNARRQLRYDQRNNTGRDAIQQSRLDVRQQEAALQQARFDQWLGDLQTNEQLDRIGHSQYIRTLERRIQRLRDIRHRTRQEQDQLNQLLQVLQEAQKALSGQFNIGDIKLPTPYEARRYIEERRAQIERDLTGPGGQGGPDRSTPGTINNNYLNRVDIDGADTGLVKRILIELLGRQALNTTSTATGKR